MARDVLVICLIILAVTIDAGPAVASLDSAKEAFKRGDEAEAVREIVSLAEAGEVEAQFHLGELYQNGRGVPQDEQKAHDWYIVRRPRKATRKRSSSSVSFITMAWALRRAFPRPP